MPMWHVLKGTSKTEYEASNLPASYKFGKEERYKARDPRGMLNEE